MINKRGRGLSLSGQWTTVAGAARLRRQSTADAAAAL